jgi:hypothetical protein
MGYERVVVVMAEDVAPIRPQLLYLHRTPQQAKSYVVTTKAQSD